MTAAKQATEAADTDEIAERREPLRLVLIAGAGIGGLATALALARRGIASHVLERRAVFAEEGAGIQIGPNGSKLLARLGVADALRSQAAAPTAIRVHDGLGGRALADLPLNPWIEARHGAPYWTLHRQDLHAALLARARAVPLIRVSAGAEIVSVDDDGRRVVAGSRDGRSHEGDALIAADGLWSRARHAHFDTTPPRFTGKSALRTVLPANALPDGLDKRAVHLWLSPNAHVVHYPVRGGSEVAIVVIIDEAEAASGWSTPVEAGVVAAHASGFAPALRELLSRPDARPGAWRKWSLHVLPNLRKLARGRIALVGDAAHPVLPFLAQGAVLAMEDAAVIADCLAAQRDVPAALRDYQRRRRRRVARVAAASRRNGDIFHLSGLAAAARNATLGAVRGRLMMARYDWLYGWRQDELRSNKVRRKEIVALSEFCHVERSALTVADISFASTKRPCQHDRPARNTTRKTEMSKRFDGSTVSSLICGEV